MTNNIGMSALVPPAEWDGPALIVGVWRPGYGNVSTCALGYDTLESHMLHLMFGVVPNFVGDFMQIPAEKLGDHKYTRIVFQGVCPVATSMGAHPCEADCDYKAIDATDLAKKVKQIASEKGAYVFFRHCIERVKPEDIDLEKRKQFIKIFEDEGFHHVEEVGNPYPLGIHHPGGDILDPEPDMTTKWEIRNGGLSFHYSPVQYRSAV